MVTRSHRFDLVVRNALIPRLTGNLTQPHLLLAADSGQRYEYLVLLSRVTQMMDRNNTNHSTGITQPASTFMFPQTVVSGEIASQ